MAGQYGGKRGKLWLKAFTGVVIVVITFLAMSLRISLWSLHPSVARMFERSSFWVVALLAVLLGLIFGQVKGNFRPLVAILTVVILFMLILGAELLFRVHGIYD